MIKCLVTAIGSMSADCVVSSLKENKISVVGCDINPGEWHATTSQCDQFYKVPLVIEADLYRDSIMDICDKEAINFILPLTDVEVDFFNIHRSFFENKGIKVCISPSEALTVARDKYNLYLLFKDDPFVPSIHTWTIGEEFVFPCIAKPKNGRSSEGLMKLESHKHLMIKSDWSNYIFQEIITGDIYTVDFVRSEKDGKAVLVSRQELLRTKNGAGTTVKIEHNQMLSQLALRIGVRLNLIGCVNMEFIKRDGQFYLIDINPRFSAGVAFSHLAGYNMVMNHMRVFMSDPIDDQILYKNQIVIKKYVEKMQ